ncbi:MAG: hypothetical protein RBR30_13250 [Tenuifilaceae bacterium]|nr:hypothetical protein [Tenuifilaceae bacterium]
MEVVVGGMSLEVSCGASNAIALGLPYLGLAGWLSAASIVISNAYNGCYESTSSITQNTLLHLNAIIKPVIKCLTAT